MNPVVLCDGGLCNRLNALVFALILEQRFGHRWTISWPLNNWCSAPLDSLFEPPFAHDTLPLGHYRANGGRTVLMQENQLDFAVDRHVLHAALGDFDAYRGWLDRPGAGIVYFHNLIPAWVAPADVHAALRRLRVRPALLARAARFCADHAIDRTVAGLHIRKTDFGDRVDDAALFAQARASTRRFFVCSDAAEVNQRFAALPNCAVFEKTALPEKLQADAAWLHWTTDAEGRRFPFNVTRSGTAVAEALIDLLILSRTDVQPLSGSTFLSMARQLGAAGIDWPPPSPPTSSSQPPLALPAESPAVIETPPVAAAAAERPVSHHDLFDLLTQIRPWQMISDTKVRIGSDGDGGYVMPASSRRSNLLLSIGIGDEVSFDNDLAALGARVIQFDHTIAASPSRHPNIEFRRQGWGARDDAPFVSLKTMVGLFDWAGARHPILKFDTEGAEWDCLADADSADLGRFEVLTGEFHGFQHLSERGYFDRVHAVFEKLGRTHRVIHLHANNAGGMLMIGGVPFPRLLELTWMRKASASFHGHSSEPIPGPLDRPNVPQMPEIHLRAF